MAENKTKQTAASVEAYLKKMADVDARVLEKLAANAVAHVKSKHG